MKKILFIFICLLISLEASAQNTNNAVIAYAKFMSFEVAPKYGLIFPDGEAFYFDSTETTFSIYSSFIYQKEKAEIISKLESAKFFNLPEKLEPKDLVLDGGNEYYLVNSQNSCKLVNFSTPNDPINDKKIAPVKKILEEIFSKIKIQGRIVAFERLEQKIKIYLKVSGINNCSLTLFQNALNDIGKIAEKEEPKPTSSTIETTTTTTTTIQEPGEILSSISCKTDEDCLYRNGSCMVPAVATGLSNVEPSNGRCSCKKGTISSCILKGSSLDK